tara:strand:+ start:634 stop:849 length:216 start_codon:yes stop_codon:yes gene_type:complete
MKIKIKYELTSNIDCFSNVWFDSRKEAEIHILDDLDWVKNKPNYSYLKHKIKKIEIQANPKKEIFRYFSDY